VFIDHGRVKQGLRAVLSSQIEEADTINQWLAACRAGVALQPQHGCKQDKRVVCASIESPSQHVFQQ
jgi:hypothetical protein